MPCVSSSRWLVSATPIWIIALIVLVGCGPKATDSPAGPSTAQSDNTPTATPNSGPAPDGANATAPTADAANVPAQFAAGRKVFDSNGCARCHSLGEGGTPQGPPESGPRRPKGPDLSQVGANPAHTVPWIEEHIRNPKSHKPESKMPAFAEKISAEDLTALAEYLASLK